MDKLIEFLSRLPKWARVVVVVLLSCCLAIGVFFSIPSCSSVKAISYGDGRISTHVSQSGADSTTVEVNFTR